MAFKKKEVSGQFGGRVPEGALVVPPLDLPLEQPHWLSGNAGAKAHIKSVIRKRRAEKRLWEESQHPRHPAGSAAGGEFAPAGEGGDANEEGKRQKNWKANEIRQRTEMANIYLDQKKAEAVAEENFNWEQKLTTGEKEEIKHYTMNGFRISNRCLRHGQDCTPPTQDGIARLRSALDKSSLPVDLTVSRTLAYKEPGTLDRFKVGASFSDKGFLSTSLNHNSDLSQAEGGNTIRFFLNLPKGAKGAYLGFLSSHVSEHEVLLPPDSKFEITEVRPPRTGRYETWVIAKLVQ